MKTEYKIVGLSVVLFALVCIGDAVLESAAFGEKPFWDSLIFDVSGHAIYSRSLVTLGFLVFGLVASRAFARQRRAEEETKRTKTLLDSVIHNLPVAVFLKTADRLEYALWNKASEELYGYSSEDLVGKDPYQVFPAKDAEAIAQEDRATLQRGTLLEIPEHSIATRHRGTRIFHTKKLPIFDEDGTPRYLVGISEDITESKEAEKALIEAREAAEQASRAKSEFLANMSHEIRTPINGIMGMTELALNTELTAEQHEYLEVVRISADSLLKVINDILDFSKIEAGKLEFITVDFGLRDVISDAMTILAVQAHRKGLEITYDVPPEIPDAVIGDPGRLRQVLVNLVGNAIKFTEQGEVGLTTRLEAENPDKVDLHFTVTDTGIGIPPDKQEKIFRAFEQADGSTSRKYGGTGLGLAISTQFVNMMEGKIWVESKVGAGTTFHFVIRLGLQHGRVKLEAPQTKANIQGLAVLVVDDNATNRRILEDTLRYWGMNPVVADNGPKAMELLLEASERGHPFPLVLTDCMMPGMDGFELVERCKQDSRLAASTIIMLTSSGERGDASRCVKLGISAYLVKPIKQSELFFTVSKVLEEPTPGETHPSLITRHSIRESKNRLNILLAEDNPVNQTVALRMLERMGHSVSLVENGKEALETIKLAGFDLVLMDVQMPLMDGLEATEALREWEKTTGKHVRVIAMTAYAMKGDEERCLAAGMDGYISKPISAQRLYEAIEDMIDQTKKPGENVAASAVKPEALDKLVILDRVGGDTELLKEIVDLFLEDYPDLLVKIREALQTKDSQLLEKTAHALKGSVGNFGAESAVQAALNLENMGRNQDLAEAPQTLVNLEKELERLREELAGFVKEIGN
ncbi:MAG: response regulator [Desulfomonile tiedjei]|nr:response regulator [Desulfomonile tiedjei]